MSDHHMRWSSFQCWTSLCWSYLLYDSRSNFRSQCSEAISAYARLVKFNPSIMHVQNWLAPVVCERRAYHTRSSRGVSAWWTVAMVHTQREHLQGENMWHDMAIIILCLWTPSPKYRHDLHCHRLDTLISIVALLSSRQLLLLRLSLRLVIK